jgi:hypothetical protein
MPNLVDGGPIPNDAIREEGKCLRQRPEWRDLQCNVETSVRDLAVRSPRSSGASWWSQVYLWPLLRAVQNAHDMNDIAGDIVDKNVRQS